MSDIKELKLDSRDFFPKSMDLAKRFLKDNRKIKLVANTLSASQTTRVAETLKREGFVIFQDIQTQTKIINDSRVVSLIITMEATPDFDKLYKEDEEQRKKRMEERKNREEK